MSSIIMAPPAFENRFMHVREERAAGTSGGTFTSGGPVRRVLNTVVINKIPGASLASDAVTLTAGRYFVMASAPAFKVGGHVVRVRDFPGPQRIYGSSEYSSPTAYTPRRSRVTAVFEFSVPSSIWIEHQCTVTKATDGLGYPANVGGAYGEVFAEMMIWKLS